MGAPRHTASIHWRLTSYRVPKHDVIAARCCAVCARQARLSLIARYCCANFSSSTTLVLLWCSRPVQRLALNSLHVCTAARQALTSAPRHSDDTNDIESQSVRSSTGQPMSSYRTSLVRTIFVERRIGAEFCGAHFCSLL